MSFGRRHNYASALRPCWNTSNQRPANAAAKDTKTGHEIICPSDMFSKTSESINLNP
jgi:hypothetical protein